MRIGIVGSEAKKFTQLMELSARQKIQDIINGVLIYGEDVTVVSGACHLGGIDIWAKEEAHNLGVGFKDYPPKTKGWAFGYRPRNIKIAEDSDVVYCITVKELPPGYDGMEFPLCYHCGTKDHVKSGGCWTVKYARNLGKPGEIIVL